MTISGSIRLMTSAALAAFRPFPPPTGTSNDVDRAEGFDFDWEWHLAQVAQVGNGNAVEIKNVQGVARFFDRFFAVGVGLHAGNKNAADFIFARVVDLMGSALDSADKIVSRRIVADGDNIGAQFKRFKTDHIAIEGVGDNCGHAAFNHAKTRVSVPGNFHVVMFYLRAQLYLFPGWLLQQQATFPGANSSPKNTGQHAIISIAVRTRLFKYDTLPPVLFSPG
jgi:hypothetical protein